MVRLICLFFLMLVFSSCVAQDPNYLRLKARDMLEVAKRKNADDERINKAKELLEEGNRQFVDSDYHLARYYFKRSIDCSQDVIEEIDEKETAAALASSAPPAPLHPRVEKVTRKLRSSKESKQTKKPMINTNDFDSSDEEEETLSSPFILPSTGRRQLPGKIIFFLNETTYQSISQKHLDEAGDFLIQHPEAKLILKAQLGEGEDVALVRPRFGPILSFFEELGIARDRVELDPTATLSDFPVFRLFITKMK